MTQTLVIVPCGLSKVWGKDPRRGPTPARAAYTGAPFIVNRAYAERFGDAWVVLSAKYGFVLPDVEIPGPYDTTFKDAATRPISVAALNEQIREQRLDRFHLVIGLGGKEYRSAVTAAFALWPVRCAFPFAGLPIGKSMQAAKRAMAAGRPIPADPEQPQ